MGITGADGVDGAAGAFDPVAGGVDASAIKASLDNIAQQMGQWVRAFNGRIIGGTFTLSAGTTTVVSQSSVAAGSIILWNATNATAALTERSFGLYISAKTAASTFSISCQGGSAAGTETFNYVLFTPS